MTAVITAASPDLVRALVRACSTTSLQRRFFLPAPLTPDVVWCRYQRYLLAGPPTGVAVVAAAGGEPIGLLNLVVVGEATVEASLLVVDAWQGTGVATCLLTTELSRPRWDGWTVTAMIELHNPAALRLVRSRRLGPYRVTGRDLSTLDFAIALDGDRRAR